MLWVTMLNTIVVRRISMPPKRTPSSDKKKDAVAAPTPGGKTASAAMSRPDPNFLKYATLTGQDTGSGPTNYIGGSGFGKFFEDIKVNIESVEALILCYKLGCTKPFSIQEAEYRTLSSLGCPTLESIPKKAVEWKKALCNNPTETKSFFLFCFSFFREAENAIVLQAETAVALWECLVPVFFPSFPLDSLRNYTTTVYKRAINKDTWRGMFDCMKAYPTGNFDAFDGVSGAWPTFVDQFVEMVQSVKATL